MKKVVIYPGRFQPMLAHHAEVFRQLQSQFPDSDVYFSTSDKVELPKSPFSFKEKQQIAQALGVDPTKVLLAPRPYNHEDYAKYFDPKTTSIIFAVGAKDVERFPFNNVDAKTGLEMTKRGEPRPAYYQKINTYKTNPQAMQDRGYITVAPTVMTGDTVASASAFRQALANAPDREAAKEVYTKQFGQFNNKVFNLIYNKVAGTQMNEQINQMRILAGLPPLAESAPVEFATQVDPAQAQFIDPTKASMKFSIANRFPKGADINDPKVKKEQFLQALLRSPESLLAEISERLDPKDDASLAVSGKLDELQTQLVRNGGKLSALSQQDKEFALEITGEAVERMKLFAGDKSPAYDPNQEPEVESINLDIVRESYNVMEGSMGAVSGAIKRRIIHNHLDAVIDYGFDAVINAIEDVASDLDDLEEIGSSDISIWTRRVLDSLEQGHYGAKREPRKIVQVGEPEQMPAGNSLVGESHQPEGVRMIYDREGIKISAYTAPGDDGSLIKVFKDDELVAAGDYDFYSGFWFSGVDPKGGQTAFRTPAEVADYFRNESASPEGIDEGPIGKVIADKKADNDKKQQEYDDAGWDLADRMFASSAKRRTPGRTAHERALLGDSINNEAVKKAPFLDKDDEGYNNDLDKSMAIGLTRGYVDQLRHLRFPGKPERMARAKDQYNKALDSVKDTPVSKFVKSRKGSGVRTESVDLREGTMAHGIFDNNPRKAMIALQGLNNVLRDALPASQAGDILYRYVFDDELYDIFDDISMMDPTTDVRQVKAFQKKIAQLRKWAEAELKKSGLKEIAPLIPLAAGAVARGVAGRMGANAIGQAVTSTATSVAVNKALSGAKPVEENDSQLAAELRQLVQKIVNGKMSLRKVYADPQGPVQQALHPKLTEYYNTIASTHRLDPGRDFKKILNGVADWLMDDFLSGDYDVVTEAYTSEEDGNLKQHVQDILNGDVDLYDVYSDPKAPLHQEVNKMYDDVVIDHHLHPDDDFETILDRVADLLQQDLDAGNFDELNEDTITESEWVELYYKGRSIGYVNDEHEYSTRRQRAMSDDEIDDLPPAVIKNILRNLGIREMPSFNESVKPKKKEYHDYQKFLKGAREHYPACKLKKQDELKGGNTRVWDGDKKVGEWDGSGKNPNRKAPGLLTVKESTAAPKYYLVTDDTDRALVIPERHLEMGTDVIASGTKAEMMALLHSGDYGEPSKSSRVKESAPFAAGLTPEATKYPYNFKFPKAWGNISWKAGVKKLNKLGLVPDLTHAELFSSQVTGPAQKALQRLLKVMVDAKVKGGMSIGKAQDAVSKEIWGVADPNEATDLSHDYCLDFFDGLAVNNRLPKFPDALQQLKQDAVKIKATVDVATAREAYRDAKDFLKDSN